MCLSIALSVDSWALFWLSQCCCDELPFAYFLMDSLLVDSVVRIKSYKLSILTDLDIANECDNCRDEKLFYFFN